MADDLETAASHSVRTSLEEKLIAFRETLTDDELALLSAGSEVEGFTFNLADVSPPRLGGGSAVIPQTTQDVSANKAKTADKAANASDSYLRS